jgi:hypothetical protein
MVVVVLLVVVSYSSVMTMAAAGAERHAFCPSRTGRLSVETHTQTQIGTQARCQNMPTIVYSQLISLLVRSKY